MGVLSLKQTDHGQSRSIAKKTFSKSGMKINY